MTLEEAKKELLENTKSFDRIDIATLNIFAETYKNKINLYKAESLKMERVIHNLVKQLEGYLEKRK